MTMRELGRLGGKARLVRMTAEQRSAIARKAAIASAVVRRKQAEKRAQRRAKQRQRDTVWAIKAFGKASHGGPVKSFRLERRRGRELIVVQGERGSLVWYEVIEEPDSGAGRNGFEIVPLCILCDSEG